MDIIETLESSTGAVAQWVQYLLNDHEHFTFESATPHTKMGMVSHICNPRVSN